MLKAHKRLALQSLLVTVIIVVALVYGLLIKPNYYRFNGGKIYFEPVYSQSLDIEEQCQIYSYNQEIYIGTENGLKKTTPDGKNVWDKTFYMNSPKLITNGQYLAMIDILGKNAYIFDSTGVLASIKVEYPILFGNLNQEGTLALVLEKDDKHLIQLYNRKGGLDVERGTVFANDGYPIALDLSSNGQKMITSYLQLNSGSMSTSITVFGFGKLGTSDPQNILGGFKFQDSLIPEVYFFDDEHFVLVSDQKLGFYYLKDVPKIETEIVLANRIDSIIVMDDCIVVAYGDSFEVNDKGLMGHVVVYSQEGQKLDQYTPETSNITLVSDSGQYYLITDKYVECRSERKLIWRYETQKEIVNIYKLGKSQYLVVTKTGYEILAIKDI